MAGGLRMGVLGPVEARRDGTPVALGTPRQRRVLTVLALHRGAAVPVDAVVELVWGDRPPLSAENLVQGYVSGLRKALERDRAPRARGEVVVLGPAGYALRVDDLDATAFEAAVTEAQREVDGARRDPTGLLPVLGPGRAEQLLERLDDALQLWRGTPYAELGDHPEAVAHRARLEELRLVCLEQRAALEIELGSQARVAADLETLTAAHPLHERLWALRALALARSGRQADALRVLATVRDVLGEELGIDPGPEVAALQLAVLRQQPTVGPRHVRAQPTTPATTSPLVGRDAELERLLALRERAAGRAGPPLFALVSGEPGVGKTRLCEELQARASEDGDLVVSARCPQDEGAPPLWPWSRVLAAAGVRLRPAVDPADPSEGFRTWGESIESLLALSLDRPLVVVLDDLQWADPSTLRVLSLLGSADRPGRLLVVLAWRADPAPPAAVSELAATLSRHHAVHLPLVGVDAVDTARIIAEVSGSVPSRAQAEELHRRTGGNPYFLVELGRLDPEHRGGSPFDGGASSDGIRAVISQRLAGLPAPLLRVLEVAAVLGREFDVALLAEVSRSADDEVVDLLEGAHAAGLLQETGINRFRFAHDLLRENARSRVTRTRAARIHAVAAEVMTRRGIPGTESDLARHWLAAGPAFAARAWPAARAAADAARAVHAHDERAQLLRAALEALDADDAALAEDRCDLLLELADALRIGGQWLALRPVVHDALDIAEGLDDVDRAFTAATLPTTGAYWLASPYGQVDQRVVAGLRRVLRQLPVRDDHRRCRAMLSLASETYYAAAHAEREALVDEAVAMARRVADRRLLLTACLAGSTSVWRSARTREQHALASEAVLLARSLDDPLGLADALTTQASAANDLGLVEDMYVALESARAVATEHRLLFSRVVLDGIEIGWCAMRAEEERLQWLVDDMTRAAEPMQLAQLQDSFVAVEMMRLMWSGRTEELLAAVRQGEERTLVPVSAFVAALLCRTGREDEAAAYLATHDLRTEVDDWLSPAIWSLTAECALHLADPALAATVYRRLAPLAGRPATAGSGIVVGPVDAFLAMAALAVGEQDTARRHADDAEGVARSWGAEPVLRWVRASRSRWGI